MKKRRDYIADILYSKKVSDATYYKYLKKILSEKQLEIYKMRFYKDGSIKMTTEEIADQLGITRQAVDSTLNRIYCSIIILCKRLNIDVDINEKIRRPKVYNITEVSDHARELIISINVLKRLPKEKYLNGGVSERVFSNGADQRRYYDSLTADIRRIHEKQENGEELSKLDTQKLFDFEVIKNELSKYKAIRKKNPTRRPSYITQIIDLRSKTIEFIKEFNKTHRLPESKYADFFSTGKKFSDGTDQRNFYGTLRYRAKVARERFDNNKTISNLDREKIIAAKLIDNVISYYPNKFYENKLMILELVTSLGINIEKNKLLLSKSYGEIYAKFRFLIENNIYIIDNDGVVNSFIYLSDEEMQKQFNISMEELTDKYINGVIDSKTSEEVIKKLSKKNIS